MAEDFKTNQWIFSIVGEKGAEGGAGMKKPKIIINQRTGYDFYEIIPVDRVGDKYIFSVPSGGGCWEKVELESGFSLAPIEERTLKMPGDWMRILHDELCKIFGDKKDTATSQKLEATQYHLEDMRTLVFKDRQNL